MFHVNSHQYKVTLQLPHLYILFEINNNTTHINGIHRTQTQFLSHNSKYSQPLELVLFHVISTIFNAIKALLPAFIN